MKVILAGLFFLLSFSQAQAVSLSRHDIKCLRYNMDASICRDMGCHYFDEGSKGLCLSLKGIKKCARYSNKMDKCVRRHCYWDMGQNLCYPKLVRYLINDEGIKGDLLHEVTRFSPVTK